MSSNFVILLFNLKKLILALNNLTFNNKSLPLLKKQLNLLTNKIFIVFIIKKNHKEDVHKLLSCSFRSVDCPRPSNMLSQL